MKIWPTPQDYNEAVQSPQICFSDQDLKNASIATNAMGLPRSASGAFASVYRAHCGNTSWAVRCFLSERPDQKERYKHISDFVLFDNLDSTVDFYYLDEGIRVKGDWYPCLKMVWVEGTTLDQFIEQHHRDAEKMTWLLREFHKLVGELEGAGIGHGDLQHGNIIVTDEGLRLVDYDALFVPALLGKKSLEYGHPNYQHPHRTEDHYDPDVDNFSCWLIHASLLAVAIDPELYKAHGGGDECILFKRTDLAQPSASTLFQSLLAHSSPHISQTAHLILRMLWSAPTAIPYLGAPKTAIDQLATEPPQSNGSTSVAKPTAVKDILDLDEAVKAIGNDKKATRKEALGFGKISTNTFKAGRQARDRIKRMADGLELATIPANWIQRRIKDGKNLFNNGDYEAATKVYLDVFKQLDPDRNGAMQIDIAVSLGYCFALSGKPSMASNYFLLALNDAKKNSDQIQHRHAALLLALSKYDDGNHVAAWKILDDSRTHLAQVADLIALEIDQPYIAKVSTCKMLKEYGLRPYQTARFDSTSIEFLQSSALIFQGMLERKPHLCDIEGTDQYLQLAGIICSVNPSARLEFARSSFLALARKLDMVGRTDQGRLARFCAVVVFNSVDSARSTALNYMSEFGQIDANELVDVATEAGKILPPEDVFNWLVAISLFFQSSKDKNEQLEALLVASRFAMKYAPAIDEQLILSLENARAYIATCLEKTYFQDNKEPLLNNLMALAAESNCINVIATIAKHLLKNNDVEGVALLCHHLAKAGNAPAFKYIMEANSNSNALAQGFDLAVSTVVSVVETYRENLKNKSASLRQGRDWYKCCEQIVLLNNFRDLLNQIDARKQSDSILDYLAVEACEIVSNWFLGVVKIGEGNRCYDFAADLARIRHFDALATILADLISERQNVIVDAILKHIHSSEGSSVIIEFCLRLKSLDRFQLYEHVSRVVSTNSSLDELVSFFEALFDGATNSNNYIGEVLTQLLKGGRSNSIAHLLRFLSRRKEMLVAERILDEIMEISFVNSPLAIIVQSEDFETLADIFAIAAATRKSKGLRKLISVLNEGKRVSVIENTIIRCLRKEVRALDEIVAQESNGSSDHDLNLKRAINSLSVLHQLRLLCHAKPSTAALKEAIIESLNERFDEFYSIWLMDMAINDEMPEASSVVVELAALKKNRCLSKIFVLLAGQHRRNVLAVLTNQLMITGHVSTAVALTIQVATVHPYETKELIATIIQNAKDDKVLGVLVAECIKVKPHVSEIAVRQIALSDKAADKLTAMAIKFTNESNEIALYMVLDQMIATDPNFETFASSLCDMVPIPMIEGLSRWLYKAGLADIPREQVKVLRRKGREDLASIWLKCLP
ncbi:MAG: hypothetical protein K2X93_18490 [Candidatus Obscuribacterales bacterium]|nr:hypothetical protein [Candidatus Obscuribacterales bacterium]